MRPGATARVAITSSIALLAAGLFAVVLRADPFAAPSTPKDAALRVDIVDPADGSRLPWQSQASYSVVISYDGKSTRYGDIPATDVVLTAIYAADLGKVAPAQPDSLPQGLVEISRSNCMGCHDFAARAVGPSYAAIGKRYPEAASAAQLADHIRNGSAGAWGTTRMPPHPDLTSQQAADIARWIIEHANDAGVAYHVGKDGSFRMSAPTDPGPNAGLVLTATYTGPLKAGDTRAAAGRSRIVVRGAPSDGR
jgi:cytochrome c551/c552